MAVRALLVALVAMAALAPPVVGEPGVDQMVVFRDGSARISHPDLAQASATVAHTRCALAGGTLALRVRSYDDRGKGVAARGATVHVGGRLVAAGSDGVARLALPRGRYSAFATQSGRIRSFPFAVAIR